MKNLKTLMFIMVLACCTFAQSYVTREYKRELKAIAGTTKVSTAIYDGLDVYTNGHDRKVFIKGLTPDNRLAVWQIHYARVLSEPNDFNPDQEALVREAIQKFVNLAYFKLDKTNWVGSPVEVQYQDLSARVRKAFEAQPEMYRRTFEIPGSKVLSVCQKIKTPTSDLLPPDCDCNWSAGCDNWSCEGRSCHQVANCGIFGDDTCQYKC
jgi:hypothetical protein